MATTLPLLSWPSWIQILYDVQSTRYSRMASNTLVIYDHLITFDDEIELIWRRKCSLSSIIFLLNRYYVLGSMLFASYGMKTFTESNVYPDSFNLCSFQCFTLLMLPTRRSILSLGRMDWSHRILQMRTFALYGLNKRLLAVMMICYVSVLVSSGIILFKSLGATQIISIPIPGGSFCGISNRVPGFYACWIPPLVYECLLCGLVIFRGVEELKITGSVFSRGQTLIRILIRDSALYLVGLAVVYLVILLFWTSERISLGEAPNGFAPTLSCILSSRVVLNVRGVFREPNPEDLDSGWERDEGNFEY
ncbi:hypothetical protein D9613_008244 [Agrocybe pediades]|uniref:DUF6533 domain-containing protein n=1 Tax=Agrocybe pediades TaxID=84607 RepID=A0A8H4QS59_9AGAR|nr:hypothetical protein D9613_008244 [Agrocybe pediades]